MARRSHTGLGFSLVTDAGEDWQPGIFLEAGVGQSQLAHNEYRTAIGLDAPGMNAVLAESGWAGDLRRVPKSDHGFSITTSPRNTNQTGGRASNPPKVAAPLLRAPRGGALGRFRLRTCK